jgi:hypothetical protein
MERDKLEQYLHYLSGEIDRYINDGVATDNEMIQFINEWNNFKTKVEESELSLSVKSKINEIDFGYTVQKVDRSYTNLLLILLTLGLWSLVLRYRMRRNRVHDLSGMRNDLNRIVRELNEY